MTYSKRQLEEIANAPRPASGTPEYQRWRRARSILGIKTGRQEPRSKRGYNREYMRQYRSLEKDCTTCFHYTSMSTCGNKRCPICNLQIVHFNKEKEWHCSLWKKRRKIKVVI